VRWIVTRISLRTCVADQLSDHSCSVAETSRRRPPSAATQRQVHTLIRNALGDAYRLELVTRNVAAQVKAPAHGGATSP
jgi:hypothetical protein